MPTILELCCGYKSISKAFARQGWDTITLDNQHRFNPTIVADMLVWDYRAYFATNPVPDVVWASPPCRTFTKQAWSKHRSKAGSARTSDAREGDRCVRACLDCIAYLRQRNPDLVFFVENPLHGAFRHLKCVRPFMRKGQSRALQYGDYAPDKHSLKPTLVLTNCDSWTPKPMKAKKSTTRWDQLSKKRRTIIPDEVCEEIAQVVIAYVGSTRFSQNVVES